MFRTNAKASVNSSKSKGGGRGEGKGKGGGRGGRGGNPRDSINKNQRVTDRISDTDWALLS